MHVLIVGGGQVGSFLAGLLLEAGHQVSVIEAREEALPLLRRSASGARCVHGNGTDPGILEASGIRTAQMVVAVTGGDATNLVITSLARCAFGVPWAAARVNNPHNAWMFTGAMGVDRALNQAEVMANLIAQALPV